jgi:hypothetical protein
LSPSADAANPAGDDPDIVGASWPKLDDDRKVDELRAVFGDVLPTQTDDDLDGGDDWTDLRRDGESANDERLRRDVPPHHGS